MTTATLEAPRARVRDRKRADVAAPAAPILQPVPAMVEVPVEEVAPLEEVVKLSPEAAKAKAIEMATALLAANAAMNKAGAVLRKLQKEFSAFGEQQDVPPFALAFGKDIYDASKIADSKDVVDIAKLFGEVGSADFLKIAKASQGDVEDHGGKTLLSKVLTSEKGDPVFKLRKRAKAAS